MFLIFFITKLKKRQQESFYIYVFNLFKAEMSKDQTIQKNKAEKYIVWLSEISKDDIAIAGGKGANLAEMYNIGLPVPPAFIVTAYAYKTFLEYNKLNDKIKQLLSNIDYENTQMLEETTAKIRELIVAGQIPEEMQQEIVEAYEILSSNIPKVDKIEKQINELFKTAQEPCFTAVRSSATAEDLLTASFAGQQETYLNVKGNDALLEAIKKCWASLFTARATYYRHKKGFSHEQTLIAVIVQKMVNSEKSGVMFTLEPLTNDKTKIVIEAVFGLGEGIVSGSIEPDYYLVDKNTLEIVKKKIGYKKIEFTRDSAGHNIKKELPAELANEQVLSKTEIKKLAQFGIMLEQHYGWPQDIEWAIEQGNIYIVQTRAVTTTEKHVKAEKIEAKILVSGLGASPGIAVGKVKIIHNLDELSKIQAGDVLVTKMTNPDMVPVMMKSAAIVTDEGGITCHAAIVSRELGIPCVVGTRNATQVLKDGMIVTVNGSEGIVYEGATQEVEEKKQEQSKASSEIKTRTKVKVICDLPQAAQRAAATSADGVGLVRIEFMIVNAGVHPAEYLRKKKLDNYTTLLVNGIKQIAEAFKDKPVWVRTSDLRTDEYRNLKGGDLEPIESDPMIGWHGIRRALDQPELLKAEFLAIKKLHEQGFRNVGVMLPFVINVDEVIKAKQIMREVGLEPCKDVEFGVMVETPAACWIIEDLCKEGISFISFGTNDLTQLTLGIDRNNERIAKLYDEMHPAVLGEMKMVIETCKKYGVKTSICGQAGSRPEMVEWLVKHGIDSISANIDAVAKVRQIVAETERKIANKIVNSELNSDGNKNQNENVNSSTNETTKPTTKPVNTKIKQMKTEQSENKIIIEDDITIEEIKNIDELEQNLPKEIEELLKEGLS